MTSQLSSRQQPSSRMSKTSKTSKISEKRFENFNRKPKKKVTERHRVYDEPDLGFDPELGDEFSRHFSRNLNERKRNEVVFFHHQDEAKKFRKLNDDKRVKVIIV